MAQDLETINRWTGSAPYWEKHREVIRQMFAGITAGLVEDAQVARGQTVLDVATGPGEPALSVAAVPTVGVPLTATAVVVEKSPLITTGEAAEVELPLL